MPKIIAALFLALTSAVHYVPQQNTVYFQVEQSLMWSGQVSPLCKIKSVEKCYHSETEGDFTDNIERKFSDIVFEFHEPECKTISSKGKGYWFGKLEKTDEKCDTSYYEVDKQKDAQTISGYTMRELRGKQVVGMRFMREKGLHTIGRTQYIVAEPEEANCQSKWSDKCAGFARVNNMRYKAINNAQSISQLKVKSKIWGQDWGSIDNYQNQTDSDTAENMTVVQADNKCRMSKMEVYNHQDHKLICRIKISFDNCAPIETNSSKCDAEPTQILMDGATETPQTSLPDDWSFLTAKNTCTDKPEGRSRKIQNIYAAHSQNGVEAIVLAKDNNKEGKVMFLGGAKSHGSKQGVTYNNNQFIDWGDDGFRVTGFRYQANKNKNAIKSLQFLGVFWESQQIACEAEASQKTASVWITLAVVIDLVVVVVVLLKFPRAKNEGGDIIQELKDNIDSARRTEMYEAISFTSIINFLFILGVAYFLLDMNEKLVVAQSYGIIMPYVFQLVAFNWLYLFISVLSVVVAGIAYSTELDCKTHEFEKRLVAWIAFGVDLGVKLITTITGGIIYNQFEHESMIPFVILSVFSLTVIHINIYDMIKVGQLHRPWTDELLKEARQKYNHDNGASKIMPMRPIGDDKPIADASATKLVAQKNEDDKGEDDPPQKPSGNQI